MRKMEKFVLKRDKAVLVIVDIQDRLATVMERRDEVVRNCLHLIESAKILPFPLLVTEQYPKGLGHTVKAIKDALPSYEPLEKITFDCCSGEGFLERMSALGKGQVILTGMETHVCVLQTCLGLLKEGYAVHVVADAVCSRKERDFTAGREMMRDAGAVITCTETVLFQLLEKAGTEAFKSISKRIK